MAANKSKNADDSNLNTYTALSFKGTEQRANYRSVSYRIDMLHVLDKKDSAAIVYQIIYRWQEHRRDEIQVEIEKRQKGGLSLLTAQEVEERMWIYMSYNDFVRETGGAISYNTVIGALDYLVNQKKVLKRRENHDPRYSDYEYCIKKEEVSALLGKLPEFPQFVAKGTKGKRQQSADSTNSGIVNTSKDSTNSGIDSTNSGTDSTNSGTDSTNSGTGLYQNWGTSQNSTQSPQITSQSSPQVITGQPNEPNNPTTQEAANAAVPTLLSLVENLTAEEMDLVIQKIQEQRQQSSSMTIPKVQETNPSSSIQGTKLSPSIQETELNSSVQESAPSSSIQGHQPAGGGKGRSGSKTQSRGTAKGVALTLQGQHILDLYDQFKGRKAARTSETIRAANGLGDVVRSDEDFGEVLKAIANDAFLKQKQVRTDLDFVYRKYDGFLDVVERARKKQPARNTAQPQLSREAGQHGEEVAEEKEIYVLWTRDTSNPALVEFVNTPRGKKWLDLAALITWEGMTEAEAMQYGWELANSMTDHETRMIAYAQQRREEQRQQSSLSETLADDLRDPEAKGIEERNFQPTEVPQRVTDHQEVLVSHPEHTFLWFDDVVNPLRMVVELTPAFPHPHWSEMEDKRRRRIALWEIKPSLEEQGLHVTIEWKHGTESIKQVQEVTV